MIHLLFPSKTGSNLTRLSTKHPFGKEFLIYQNKELNPFQKEDICKTGRIGCVSFLKKTSSQEPMHQDCQYLQKSFIYTDTENSKLYE